MKKVIFVHNLTGKEIVVTCENLDNKIIDNESYYLCTVHKDNEDRTMGIFPFSHYSMYVREVFLKPTEKTDKE